MLNAMIWMGTEAAHKTLAEYQAKYQFDPVAQMAYLDEEDEDDRNLHPDFMVKGSRIGLSVMEKVGDAAVIKVHGSLVNKFSRWHTWFPGHVTSYEAIKDALLIAADSEGTKRIVMDFASGGGQVAGLDLVTTLMDKVRTKKTILGHSDLAAYSAAYWMMAGCDRLTGSRMAGFGSIGTLAVVATMADPDNHYDMSFTVFRAGEFKALGTPYEKLSDTAKATIQKDLETANTFFLEHVSLKRNLMVSEKSTWAEGKTFYAAEAVQLGLVDQIATLEDLIGSGTAANNPGDNRSYGMKISEEKRAQIAAGADPKAVLTAEELVQYNAEIAEAAKASAEENELSAEEQEAARIKAEQAANPSTAGPTEGADVNAELKALLKENGKLEAKLEAQDERLTQLEEQLTAAKAESASLLAVAKVAVGNLQVATQSPKEEKSTATEVLGQFNDLQSKMAKIFPVGQNSRATATEDSSTAIPNASAARPGYRTIPGAAQKKS